MGIKINKRKLRVRRRKLLKFLRSLRYNTIFIKLAVILTLVYLFWHLGRYYEYQRYEQRLADVKDYTTETFYFVDPVINDPIVNTTKELYIEGEVEWGRCLTREGVTKIFLDYDN
jgi:hypothetical protein